MPCCMLYLCACIACCICVCALVPCCVLYLCVRDRAMLHAVFVYARVRGVPWCLASWRAMARCPVRAVCCIYVCVRACGVPWCAASWHAMVRCIVACHGALHRGVPWCAVLCVLRAVSMCVCVFVLVLHAVSMCMRSGSLRLPCDATS